MMQELLRRWREGLGMVHADNSAPGQSFTYTGQQQSCRDAVAASNASQSDVNQLIGSVIELVESIYIENVNGMRQQALVHTTLVHNTSLQDPLRSMCPQQTWSQSRLVINFQLKLELMCKIHCFALVLAL